MPAEAAEEVDHQAAAEAVVEEAVGQAVVEEAVGQAVVEEEVGQVEQVEGAAQLDAESPGPRRSRQPLSVLLLSRPKPEAFRAPNYSPNSRLAIL